MEKEGTERKTRLTLVRHTSVDVAPGICYGQTDVPLKSTFPEEAAVVKRYLDGKRFGRVFTSPLSRCVRLAGFCGYGDTAVRDNRLMEMDFGEWEMQRYDEIKDPRMQEWYADYFNVPATGGESFADQRDRIVSFLRQISEEGSDADGSIEDMLIFTHGGVILQMMMLSGLVTRENAFASQPPYGGIVTMNLPQVK